MLALLWDVPRTFFSLTFGYGGTGCIRCSLWSVKEMVQLQSGTPCLRESIWHCIPLAVSVSLALSSFAHLPKSWARDQRQGQPEAHGKWKENQSPFESSSATAHPPEQARTSRLIVFRWCRGTSCVCTSPGRAFIHSSLKGLNSSGRGRSCSVCPSGLPNLSHLKGESHYKEVFPLLPLSAFSHFSVSSLFGSYWCWKCIPFLELKWPMSETKPKHLGGRGGSRN